MWVCVNLVQENRRRLIFDKTLDIEFPASPAALGAFDLIWELWRVLQISVARHPQRVVVAAAPRPL